MNNITNNKMELISKDFHSNLYFHNFLSHNEAFIITINEDGLNMLKSFNLEYADEIMNIFKEKFTENSTVAILKYNNPLYYSLNSELLKDKYTELIEAYAVNNDVSCIIDDDGNYIEDFQNAFADFLRFTEGPGKVIFGKTFAEIIEPTSCFVQRFYYNYLVHYSN